jgi:predicted N-formylglutamate amidohydrolase
MPKPVSRRTLVPAALPPLLAAGEPPPFAVHRRRATTPLLFVCDHASNRVPRSLAFLGLSDAQRRQHIAWDIGAAAVAEALARRFVATLAETAYSRLVVDCNRRLDDPTLIPAVSDGVPVPGNRGLGAAERRRRIDALYRPYHAALESLVAEKRRRHAAPALVSIHSCTPTMNGFDRPWHIGVLWNEDGRLPLPILAALRRQTDLVIGDNEPYSGRENVGHTVKAHAEAHGLPHVSFEIRQDLIATRDGALRFAGIVGDALAAAFAELGLA